MIARLNQKELRRRRLSRNRRIVFFSGLIVFLILYGCAAASLSSGVQRDETPFRLMQEARRQEADIVNRVHQGTYSPPPTKIQELSIPMPNPEAFLKLQPVTVEHIRPIGLAGAVAPQTSHGIPSPDDPVPALPQDGKAVEAYVYSCLSLCRELISWVFPDGKEGEYSYPFSPPQVEHLFQTGYCSAFCDSDDIANNGGVRYRLPATYTDLARMLCIYTNTRDISNKAEIGIQEKGSLGTTQLLTGAMYGSYQLAWQMVQTVKENYPDSVYDQAVALHDALCENTTYDNTYHAADNQNLLVHALLHKRATSAGYARAYMLLLTLAGIDNVYVTGKFRIMPGMSEVPQAWNLVRLEGKWVHIDVAADDQYPQRADSANKPSHSYFALSDNEIAHTHSGVHLYADNPKLCVADTEELNYFHHTFALMNGKKVSYAFGSVEELAEVIVSRHTGGCSTAEYKLLIPDLERELEKAINERNPFLSLSITPADSNGVIRVDTIP